MESYCAYSFVFGFSWSTFKLGDSLMWLCVVVVCSLSLLCGVPFCELSTMYGSILELAVQIAALLLTSCVTGGNLFDILGSQVPCL